MLTLPNNSAFCSGFLTPTPWVYVVDSGNNRVQAFNYDGYYRFQFGSLGSGNGQFNTPYGVANDDENVFVTDTGNARIQKFTLLGVYVSQWGGPGTAAGEFEDIKGIAADNMFVYAVDKNNHRFQVFTKDGQFVYSIGTFGSGYLQFSYPTNISVDDAYIYIDDTGNNRIVIIPKYFPPSVFLWPNFDMVVTAAAETRSISGDLKWPDFNWVMTATASSGNLVTGHLIWPEWNITAYTGGEGNLIWPEWFIEGILSQDNVVTGSLIWPEWFVSGVILSGSLIEGSLIWPEWMLIASTVPGYAAEGSLIWPGWTISGTLIQDSIITGNLVWPEWFINGVLSSETANPVFTCIVMNIMNKALSEYSDYPFIGFAKFKGRYFATDGKTGIYELIGNTDNEATITGTMKFRIEDLAASGTKHRIKEAYITGRNLDNVSLSLEEETGRLIPLQKSQALKTGDLIEIRFKAPKGLRGRFYSVVLQSADQFDLNSLRLFDEEVSLRVR